VTWVSKNNSGFSATQFQSVAVHPTDRNFLIGGTQDNGTQWQKADGSWFRVDYGDGGYALIDQNAADTTNVTMYHTYFNQAGGLLGFARVITTGCASDDGNISNWAFRGAGYTDPTIGCGNVAIAANTGRYCRAVLRADGAGAGQSQYGLLRHRSTVPLDQSR
jgi:hypothetical protein